MGLGLTSNLKKTQKTTKTSGKATFKSKSLAQSNEKSVETIMRKNVGIGLKQDDLAAKIRDSLEEKDYSMHYLSPRCKAVEESSHMPQARLDRIVEEVNYMSKQLLTDLGVPVG